MKIAAIMPCMGRAEQTVANVKRLLATAGDVEWELYLVADNDREVLRRLLSADMGGDVHIDSLPGVGYWRVLQTTTKQTDAPFLINLANDLLPGMHWLKRAADAYQATFGDGPGMIGFNGDSHEVGHSCHFLISRKLLERYGGWPVWYDHNFGDTELCQRAIADGLYAKAPWALLYHNHPYWGGADDEIYAKGRASVERDQALYGQRGRAGWPYVSP